MLHNTRLSGMKDRIIQLWLYGKQKINTGEVSPEDRYDRFLKSANCLILRESEEELRELTVEELMKKMSWNDKETDYLFHSERDVSDQVLLNSLDITSYVEKKRATKCGNKKNKTAATGTLSSENSTPTTTSDSSTESPSS